MWPELRRAVAAEPALLEAESVQIEHYSPVEAIKIGSLISVYNCGFLYKPSMHILVF